MTEEQAKLVLAIVSQLDSGTVHGDWPDTECRYCTGGYGSHGFAHRPECIVPLIEQLRRTTWEETRGGKQ